MDVDGVRLALLYYSNIMPLLSICSPSAPGNNIRRLRLQVKNDLGLPVAQLLHDLSDLKLKRSASLPPIAPVSGDKLLDQILKFRGQNTK